MHFIDLKSLINHLKEGRNTQGESFRYLLGYIIVNVINFEVFYPREAYTPSTASLLGAAIGTIIGCGIAYFILKSYYTNNGGDKGKDFLHRVLSLGWVVGWRTTAVALPIIGVAYFLTAGIVQALIILSVLFGAIVYLVITINQSLRIVSVEPTISASSSDSFS